jgi:hypothetical protein|tara:strand:- start:4310 stop:4453 length:144 start_codon:yes stop_codon:yes gene_type:complete
VGAGSGEKIEKGFYEDLSQANAITLRAILQQYSKDLSTIKNNLSILS